MEFYHRRGDEFSFFFSLDPTLTGPWGMLPVLSTPDLSTSLSLYPLIFYHRRGDNFQRQEPSINSQQHVKNRRINLYT